MSKEAEETPLLEAATKQQLVKTEQTEKTCCVIQRFVECVDSGESYTYL
jgi:hypothetical protein